jgi:D-alanyl-D-alanine carboxypeptidase (penicillin-binding protein 5/6)
MRLISVIFGSSTPDARTASSMALLDFGFAAYETHRLYSRGDAVARARVFKGKLDTLALGPAEDVYVTVPRGEYPNLELNAALKVDLIAPLEQQTAVGELDVSLAGRPIAKLPLVALEDVREGWLLTRMTGGVALWFD